MSDQGPNQTGNPAGLAFFDQAVNLLHELKKTQSAVIEKAADLCADRIAKGGLIFLFGNGHSRMMVEEMTPRQGGFPGFVALVETALSNHAAIIGANGLRSSLYLENYEGYAEHILDSFFRRHGVHFPEPPSESTMHNIYFCLGLFISLFSIAHIWLSL